MRIVNLVCLALLLSTGAACAASGGTVVFFSSPSGAEVRMVGSPLESQAPVGYQDVAPGTYHVVFTHGQKRLKHSFRVVAGKTLHITANFDNEAVLEKYLGDKS